MRRDVPAGSLSIVIVDPHLDAVESLATLFRMLGHRVATAGDGQTALAATHAFSPDLVILELRLPRVDGYVVARELSRTMDRRPVFVAVTTQHDLHGRSAAEGFYRHLLKPADPEEVDEILREVVEYRQCQPRRGLDSFHPIMPSALVAREKGEPCIFW